MVLSNFISISKHLMLLFNAYKLKIMRTIFAISKHLMLLFNNSQTKKENNCGVISKHLMLLFNLIYRQQRCHLHHFKTSHVIV